MLLSFVLDKLYFISNSLRSAIATVAKWKMVFREKMRNIHLKVICYYCNGLSASQDKENCSILLYLVNTNENHYSNTAS